jgi:hypothetical protein
MAVLRRVSVPFTTDAAGAALVYSDAVTGFLEEVFYDYGNAATGSDFTITEEDTGRALLTITDAGVADVSWRPRIGPVPVANTGAGTVISGGGSADKAGGNGNADVALPVVGRIKIVVAQGGATTSGTLYFYLSR